MNFLIALGITAYLAGAVATHALQRRDNAQWGFKGTHFDDNVEAVLWPIELANELTFRALRLVQDSLRPVFVRYFPNAFRARYF